MTITPATTDKSSVGWASAKRVPGPGRAPLGFALATVLAAQVALAAAVPLLPEEAYHWNFARHPDWSYFDHPPMIAWSIALGRLVFGDTRLGVRLVPLLFALGTTWLLARMARRLYGDSAALWAVLLYALIPAAFLVGFWGFPDSPMLFFWTLTLTWVWRALESRRPGWWLAAGAALGRRPAVEIHRCLSCAIDAPLPASLAARPPLAGNPMALPGRCIFLARFHASHLLELDARVGIIPIPEPWSFTGGQPL